MKLPRRYQVGDGSPGGRGLKWVESNSKVFFSFFGEGILGGHANQTVLSRGRGKKGEHTPGRKKKRNRGSAGRS